MAKHFRQARRRMGRKGTSSALRPLAEPLEERQLLSNVFTVTNTLDDGSTGSLRWAITQVDGDASDSARSPDRIDFNIPQSDSGYAGGVWTIKPVSGLPIVTNPVVIDGYTQTGASPNTNGPGLGDNATLTIAVYGRGLDIQSSNVVVRGLIVERSGDGIVIGGGNDDVIAGNFIGTNGLTSSLPGNGSPGTGNYAGIFIDHGSGNTIGGATSDARNLISNNGDADGFGIYIDGGQGNVVAGNFIGTDATGTLALPNGNVGISIEASNGNTIGGVTPGARNVIAGRVIYGSGEGYAAVTIDNASNNVIDGNFIGTDVTGTAALPPGAPTLPFNSVGVAISGDLTHSATGNTIGGIVVGAGNVISGWGREGILIGSFDYPASDTVIEGNFIGTDATGLKSLGNGTGIEVQSPGTTIGGTTATARNVISGNNGAGVIVSNGFTGSASTANLLIDGNYIGTDANGENALPNQSGVDLEDVQNSTIGGTARGAGNVVSGNAGDGVMIVANPNQPAARGNWIAGDLIGTDATGQNPLGNGGDGVFLSGTTPAVIDPRNVDEGEVRGNTIGGTVAGSGNIIAFNRIDGVAVVDSSQDGGPIEENSIYDNGKLGIDLGGTTVPLINGEGRLDYPFLTGESLSPGSASSGGPTTTITGTFNGPPYATARIEFFSNPTSNPSGFGEGKNYLGSLDVTPTDENGTPTFAFTYKGDLTGQFITATTTHSGYATSEFSPDFPPPARSPVMTLSATPNPALAGQDITVTVFLPNQPLHTGNTAVTPSVRPTGGVTLSVDGGDGGYSVNVLPGVNPQGIAGMIGVVALTNLDPGTHIITAHYYGGSFPPGDSSPLTVTVVNNLPSVVGLTVSPDPASLGQPVTFTAAVTSFPTVPGQQLPSPGGFVDFREGTVTLAHVPVDATGHATLTTNTLGVGSHQVVAYYEGNSLFAPTKSNAVTAFVNPAVGPTVLSVLRHGIHAQPTTIVLNFSQPLDTASAENTNNYVIRGPGHRRVRVNFATYNAAADTVTLTPARSLSLHARYTLTVNGTAPYGVADVYGNLLDGAGHNGTNYVTSVTRRNLVRDRHVPAGPRPSSRSRQ